MTRQSQVGWAQTKIGLLVVMGLVVLAFIILRLEEGMGLMARKSKFRALVDHTQGLKVGGPVRMNGVDIGNIHDIDISPDTALVEIKFTVKKEVAFLIREDASINIKALGLLGDKFLEIVPGHPEKPLLPPGSIIKGRSGSDITDLASGASMTMDKVNAALEQIQRALTAITQGQGTSERHTHQNLTGPELYGKLHTLATRGSTS